MDDYKHLLIGCSFTDPTWQTDIPWSIEYSRQFPSYIVAKAGMGIKGICTEALYHLPTLGSIKKIIIILPTLWRMDIEMDQETYLCNCMVDLLGANGGEYKVLERPFRKWIASGGLHFPKDTEQAKIFEFLYKHQGFLVIAKEHFKALQSLLDYCKLHDIEYHISAIQDPMDQMLGLDYIRSEILKLLTAVEYHTWFKFDGKFIDKFLGHHRHPTTEEHRILCQHILNKT